jgi:hypothetical protein
MVRSEGKMSLKNPVTPPGIDPGTVRLVAQREKGIVVHIISNGSRHTEGYRATRQKRKEFFRTALYNSLVRER